MQAPLQFLRKPGYEPKPAIVGSKVELQLFTTLQCNLRCTYCSESVGGVRGSAGGVRYSFESLDRFIRTHLDGLDINVTFYGGEPTLNIDFMRKMVEAYPGFRYQLQTNGTLLNRVPDVVLRRLENILVSIDGGRETTDSFRGRGVYNRVMRNIERLRGRMPGLVTARVTWSRADTTADELEALLDPFDYVYFQFAHLRGFYGEADMEAKKRVLAELAARFFACDGLYAMVPIMGIVRNKVRPELAGVETAGLSQCRVSTHLINVLPDGSIYPCPDLLWAPELRQGDVSLNWLAPSALQPSREMPCEGCEAFGWCRRNCMKNLYVAYVRDDSEYRHGVVEPVCELLRFLGREIDRHDPQRWFASAPEDVRAEIQRSPLYQFVEVLP